MFAGIDIGSRTIKVAVFKDGRLAGWRVEESGFDPQGQALRLLAPYAPAKIVATGYGRNLAKDRFADEVITEIKAHALGARHFFPACRTVLDVGGQDSKVIALAANGKVANFEMNDKCAAGTGRFLEIMAASLGFSLEAFGAEALRGAGGVQISSMCTVFAESEVISLKNSGRPPRDIARAVHQSVVDRLVAMLHRGGAGEHLVFAGGVAKNSCIARLLGERLGRAPVLPSPPDIAGAVGAALHAAML